jgi:hypothetical protein
MSDSSSTDLRGFGRRGSQPNSIDGGQRPKQVEIRSALITSQAVGISFSGNDRPGPLGIRRSAVEDPDIGPPSNNAHARTCRTTNMSDSSSTDLRGFGRRGSQPNSIDGGQRPKQVEIRSVLITPQAVGNSIGGDQRPGLLGIRRSVVEDPDVGQPSSNAHARTCRPTIMSDSSSSDLRGVLAISVACRGSPRRPSCLSWPPCVSSFSSCRHRTFFSSCPAFVQTP